MQQKAAAVKAATKAQNRDFIRVGRSRIAGKGVFAKRKIPKGTRIVEYLGERVPYSTLVAELTRGERDPTYLFRLNESFVVDGSRGGSDGRFINHSCEPNCEAYVFDDRAYIYAMRDISRGEELTFDYMLGPAFGTNRLTKQALDAYICNCGSAHCRGSMIARVRKRRPK